MSLWGNKDLVANTSTIAVNLGTNVVTGAATTFVTVGVKAGDVITIGAGATYGYAVVSSVSSNTVLSIASTQHIVAGVTTVPAGTSYLISQEPIYTLHDSVYRAPVSKTTGFSTSPVFTAVVGISTGEQYVANAATGNARKFAPAHAGWVGITTYYDTHGNLRVKTETLVAGSTIVTDSDDDAQYPDT
jgi:hypothetical protein